MGKKICVNIILSVVLAIIMAGSALAFTGGGSGTSASPFQINSCSLLQEMNDSLTSYYIINTSFSCSGTSFRPVASAAFFTGNLDGNGKTVSNLLINDTSAFSLGLFSFLNGNVSDITFTNLTVIGNNNVGGVAGYSYNTTLSNVSIGASNINGSGNVGGLIGQASSFATAAVTITKSDVNATIGGTGNTVGGMIGLFDSAGTNTIQHSWTDGIVEGTSSVGGFIGSNSGTTTIDNVTSYGNVTGTTNIGGIGGNTASTTYQNISSQALVTGTTNVGGIAGTATSSSVTNAFARTTTVANPTSVTETQILPTNTTFSGGLSQTVTLPTGLTYTGANTTNSVSGNQVTLNFTASGTHTVQINTSFINYNVTISVASLNDSDGDGYAEVANCTALQQISGNLSDSYELTADIDCAGVSYDPIGDGSNPFTGSIKSNNFKIDNVTISGTEYLGVVAYAVNATFDNITVEDVNISGTNYLGGLVGRSVNSNLTNTTVSGIVSGTDYVGGIVGSAENGTITTGTHSGTVDGRDYVGTIGKSNEADVTSVTSSANITGTRNYAGLIGFIQDADVQSSSATGVINGSTYVGLVGGGNNTEIISSSTNNTLSGSTIGGIAGTLTNANITSSSSTATITVTAAPAGLQYATGTSVTITGSTGGVTFSFSAAQTTMNSSTITSLSQEVQGVSNFSGVGGINTLMKNGNDSFLEYAHNYSTGGISYNSSVTLEQGDTSNSKGYAIASSVPNVVGTKTIYVNRTNTSLTGVCIKDANITNITNITNSCNGADETNLACDGTTSNGYTCTLESSGFYKITGLQHSGIVQHSAPASSSSSSGGGGGGGGGGSSSNNDKEETCAENWACESWSSCEYGEQTRSCYDANSCGTTTSKPRETQSCESYEEIEEEEEEEPERESEEDSEYLADETVSSSKSPDITAAAIGLESSIPLTPLIAISVLTVAIISSVFVYRRLK